MNLRNSPGYKYLLASQLYFLNIIELWPLTSYPISPLNLIKQLTQKWHPLKQPSKYPPFLSLSFDFIEIKALRFSALLALGCKRIQLCRARGYSGSGLSRSQMSSYVLTRGMSSSRTSYYTECFPCLDCRANASLPLQENLHPQQR